MRWGGSFVDRKAEEWRIVKVRCKEGHGKSKKPPRPPKEMRWRTGGVSRRRIWMVRLLDWYTCQSSLMPKE